MDPNNKSTGQPVGVVSIANEGRRPLYIKLVYLDVPKKSGQGPVILRKSLEGRKLGEGDAEYVISISNDVQAFMQKHFAKYWKNIRAVAVDNCGREYKSATVSKQPSWAVSST